MGTMPPKPLTPTEERTLEIISALLAQDREPTMTAVAELLGISKSGARKHMDSLREKGWIKGPRIVGKWELAKAAEKDTN